jgi:hypothetical protein
LIGTLFRVMPARRPAAAGGCRSAIWPSAEFANSISGSV